jgi:Tfp pilus assembly protein PilE
MKKAPDCYAQAIEREVIQKTQASFRLKAELWDKYVARTNGYRPKVTRSSPTNLQRSASAAARTFQTESVKSLPIQQHQRPATPDAKWHFSFPTVLAHL